MRHLIIRYIKPLIWRIDSDRKSYFLQDFSLLELDSAWQSMNAIPKVNSKSLKASLFQHALEEFYHFELFRGLSKRYSSKPLLMPALKREHLLDFPYNSQNLTRFLTYLHVGEKEVNSDFGVYAESASGDKAIKDAFLRIQQDEEKHEDDTLAWLTNEYQISKIKLNYWIIRHTLVNSLKTYEQVMKNIGQLPVNILLAFIYFIMGGFLRISVVSRFHFTQEQELDVFKKSLSETKKIIQKSIQT